MFTLLEADSGAGSSNDTKTRLPNVVVEITTRCRLSLAWNEKYARYAISMNKFKLEEQSCLAAKLNIMHTDKPASCFKCKSEIY